MQRYILRRLLMLIPTLLGVSIVVFLVMRLIPGDAISSIFPLFSLEIVHTLGISFACPLCLLVWVDQLVPATIREK